MSVRLYSKFSVYECVIILEILDFSFTSARRWSLHATSQSKYSLHFSFTSTKRQHYNMFQPFMSTRCTSTFYEYEGCLITPFANDLRVREVNLVSEYTHSFNEKCFSSAVRLWIDSFAPSPVPPVVQNERIQVQIECVRCKNHSVVDGASKHAWLPSQTAFTTLASPRPYHPILGKRRDLRE